jgi:hypothetical protein
LVPWAAAGGGRIGGGSGSLHACSPGAPMCTNRFVTTLRVAVRSPLAACCCRDSESKPTSRANAATPCVVSDKDVEGNRDKLLVGQQRGFNGNEPAGNSHMPRRPVSSPHWRHTATAVQMDPARPCLDQLVSTEMPLPTGSLSHY